MARHVFFSFHYKDVAEFRANIVRKSWVTKNKNNDDVFYDASIWESAKTKGVKAIKELIDKGLKYSSVTAVLIGSETHSRRWVKYEIFSSFEDGNGLIGLYINRIRGKDSYIQAKGLNPFDRLGLLVSKDGKIIHFYELVDRRWQQYKDLPSVTNKKSNSVYFDDGGFLRQSSFGKFFKFSELFPTFCWRQDDGYNNITEWVEIAAKKAGR